MEESQQKFMMKFHHEFPKGFQQECSEEFMVESLERSPGGYFGEIPERKPATIPEIIPAGAKTPALILELSQQVYPWRHFWKEESNFAFSHIGTRFS